MKLTLTNISKRFLVNDGLLMGGKRIVQAVDSATLEIEPGQSLGVVGESGSGKTTLAKVIAGFIQPEQGTATLGDQNLLALSREKRAHLVQMVFQDPFGSLNPKLLLGTQLLETMPGRADSRSRADQLLADVGLHADTLSRYPHQISGGQRQRFAIARALSMEPQLLLADEPVSSLDLSVQAQIINLLNDLRRAKKFSQMVISHDLAVIANTCDHVIIMKEGKIVEQGPVDEILSSPKQPYTQRLLKASPAIV